VGVSGGAAARNFLPLHAASSVPPLRSGHQGKELVGRVDNLLLAGVGSALGLAARKEARIGKTGLAIRLTEPNMPPIFGHVLPLTGSDFRTRLQPVAVAALFISAPPDAQDGADAVAPASGLTAAETKVLASLFAGRTLAETAATLAITRPTAKTHLEHTFLKIGVTRQAELMRLWTRLISPTTGSTRVSG
jgi:DNA-binding CsgD family transcriptional regulator